MKAKTEVNAKALLRALKAVKLAMCKDETRISLQGVNVKVANALCLLLETTDGHRLHRVEVPVENVGELKNGGASYRLLATDISVLEAQAKAAKEGNVTLTVMLEGSPECSYFWPDSSQVVPEKTASIERAGIGAAFEPSYLVDAFAGATSLAGGKHSKGGVIPWPHTEKDGPLRIDYKNVETGEAFLAVVMPKSI